MGGHSVQRWKKRKHRSRREFLKFLGIAGAGAVSASLINWPIRSVVAQSADTTVSSGSELQEAVSSASPGEVIVAEPGEYNVNGKIRATTPDITVQASNDAVLGNGGSTSHIIDDSGIGGGGLVELRADNVTFRGFEISNSGAKGIEINGDPDGVEVAHVDVHDCYNWGVMTNSGTNHMIRDSHAHDNRGSGGNSDGFNGTGSEGCTFLRCHAWNNSDDGFDMWTGTNHTLRYCWAWNNGPDGNAEFKLGTDNPGGGGHTVERCVAHSSDFAGFLWNLEDDNPITVRNCTAFNCSPGFHFEEIGHTIQNCISNDNSASFSGPINESNNTWNLDIDDPMFQSTDPNSDNFLRLAQGSPCIDAGADVGVEYEGSAPDLGAFERGMEIPGPGTSPSSGSDSESGGGTNGGESSSDPSQNLC